MAKHIILGVHITHRVKNAPDVQKLLTQYGCSIKTRIGFHDVGTDYCSPSGLLLLEMFGEESEIDALHGKLKAIKDLDVQRMEFDHTE